jgi:hypothetical protein
MVVEHVAGETIARKILHEEYALGWLCVRAWRFGEEPHVGGFGHLDDLVMAYEGESGTVVDRDALAWWDEVAAAVRATVADKLAIVNPDY